MSERTKYISQGRRYPPQLLLGLTAVDQEWVSVSSGILTKFDSVWRSGKQAVAVLDEHGEVVDVRPA